MENKFKFKKDSTVEYRYQFAENEEYKILKENFLKSNPPNMQDTYQDVYEINVKNTLSVFDDKLVKANILLAGEVQSGKTNNMLFIAAALKGMGFNKIIYFTGTKNNLNAQNARRFAKFFESSYFNDFSKTNSFFSQNDDFEILYGIKQNLENISDLISEKDASYFEKFKILIIDDECDEASSEKTRDNRAINANIVKLLKVKFKQIIYLQVTATPYANLTSYTDELTPDYVIPLVSSTSYCGMKKFIDKDLYKQIDQDVLQKIQSNTFDEKTETFLLQVVIDFLLQCFRNNKNYQFLVNMSSLTINLKNYDKVFRKIISILKIKDKNFYEQFLGADEVKEFKEIILQLEVKIVKEGIDYKPSNKSEIIIGGNLLSRGITFDNLLYEIMINHSAKGDFSSDTLLQRARWFGYRLGYLEKMRIYTSPKGYKFYNEILAIDEEIRQLYTKNFINSPEKVEQIKDIFKKHSYKWTN